MKFDLEISRYVLGNRSPSDLPEIATYAIQDELESESLIILAGMSPSDNSFEIQSYFISSIKELGIQLPTQFEAATKLAEFYSDEILNGKVDVIEGTSILLRECVYLVDNQSEDEGLWKIYILFHSYEDYIGGYIPYENLNQTLKSISEEIIKEIKEWRENN